MRYFQWTQGTLGQVGWIGWVVLAWLAPLPGPLPVARADYALYTLPGTNVGLRLRGKVTYNSGGTVSLRHPRGTLHFSSRDLQVVKSPSVEAVFGRRARSVLGKKDVNEIIKLSKWALHNGMLGKCKSLLGDAWKVDPEHPQLRKLAGLMKYLNRPTITSSQVEAHARDFVGGKSMKVMRSKHFLLLHDGDPVKDPIRRKTRAEMRLDLLETVYESYFLTFALEGLYLRPPRERMEVVLFSRHADFMLLERRLKTSLRQTAGFYLPDENIAIFYDSGTTPAFQQLQKLSDSLGEIKREMKRNRRPGGGEVIRFANTIELLIDIQRETDDVSVVSHEAVHQLAGNTDLFPREGIFVRWVHEGLASFFESAKLATWSGVGVVDQDRIGYYRVLESDPLRGSMEYIVSDLGFLVEASLGNQLPAYGQAWALTHFMFNERFDQMVTFYRKIQEIPDDLEPKEKGEKLLATFDDVFGDRVKLELEWRRYMRSLKTDQERLASELRK